MIQKICVSAVLFLCSAVFLTAENYSVSSQTKWVEGEWILTISYPLERSEMVLPALKSKAEDTVSDDLKDIIFNQIQSLVLDSRTTVKEYIQQHPESISGIYALSNKAHRTYSILSGDMKSVEIQYILNLYPDIAGLFMQHKQRSPISPLLRFVPSTDFTGIIIYIKKTLPLFGKISNGSFIPSLFPRIFDDTMNLVMDKYNVDPESIRKWGTVGFRRDLNMRNLEKRVGLHPLKIAARGLFGINNTDIIIPASEAAKILSRKSTINLIYSGRIIIIY